MIRSFTVALLIAVTSACLCAARAQTTAPIRVSDSLSRAADEFKVKLSPRSYSASVFGNRMFEGAFIDGFEKIPVTAYGAGVDYAIVRYSSREVKDGYYKARVVPLSPISKVGKTKVKVQLINTEGLAVHTYTSVASVFSLKLAKNSDRFAPTLEFISNASSRKGISSVEDFGNIEVMGTACCPNGMCGICIGKGCPIN